MVYNPPMPLTKVQFAPGFNKQASASEQKINGSMVTS